MKLKTRIHLFSTALMLIVIVFMTVFIYQLFERMAYDTEYNQLSKRSEELIVALSKADELIDPNTILRAYMPPNGSIRVIGSDNKILTKVQSAEGIEEITIEQSDNAYTIQDWNGIPLLSTAVPTIWVDGSIVQLQFSQMLEDVQQNMEQLRLILIGVTVFSMLPILASSVALGKLVTKPIDSLILTMSKSRQSGTYETIDIEHNRKDELATLSLTFNEMMEQLEQNFVKQEQFVSNASHELKTPLTVIESYASLLNRRGFDNKEVSNEAIQAILKESSRMRVMIEQMLQAAKYRENGDIQFIHVSIQKILEETLSQMKQAYNRNFQMTGNLSVHAYTNEAKLKQLLFILLDNARKYSEHEIIIYIKEENNYVTISVQDFGEGIDAKHLPYLFERFYRIDEGRSRKMGGTGLGLAIAKEIVTSLHGEIKIESERGIGTSFIIHLPKSENLINF